METVSSIEDEV